MSTFSVIYVDMKCVIPRVGHTDIHTDRQSDQVLSFQELLYATKKLEVDDIPLLFNVYCIRNIAIKILGSVQVLSR